MTDNHFAPPGSPRRDESVATPRTTAPPPPVMDGVPTSYSAESAGSAQSTASGQSTPSSERATQSAPAAHSASPSASVGAGSSTLAPGADGVMYTAEPHHDASGYSAPPTSTPPRPPVGRLRGGTVAFMLILALVVGAGGGLGGAWAYDEWIASTPQAPVAQPGDRGNLSSAMSEDGSGPTVASVAASVMPSVVSIESLANGTPVSTGSGFVIREDGYLLTNTHVISQADSITVVMADGSEHPAELVGATEEYDLAVLKIEQTGLTPLEFADSSSVRVGDQTIAVGSPLGLEGTVTTGIVSALHRPVTAGDPSGPAYIDAIQTDAAINPGNSGGPLLNAVGQVIGVNSAIAAMPGAGAAGSVGLGFAIPSNQAQRTANQLIETGVATYPVVGVQLDRRYQGEGVMVVDDAAGVVANGPAHNAGVLPGDIITAIDGRPITRVDELVVQIRAKAVGEDVVLTIQRGDRQQELTVTLDSSAEVVFETGELEPESQD